MAGPEDTAELLGILFAVAFGLFVLFESGKYFTRRELFPIKQRLPFLAEWAAVNWFLEALVYALRFGNVVGCWSMVFLVCLLGGQVTILASRARVLLFRYKLIEELTPWVLKKEKPKTKWFAKHRWLILPKSILIWSVIEYSIWIFIAIILNVIPLAESDPETYEKTCSRNPEFDIVFIWGTSKIIEIGYYRYKIPHNDGYFIKAELKTIWRLIAIPFLIHVPFLVLWPDVQEKYNIGNFASILFSWVLAYGTLRYPVLIARKHQEELGLRGESSVAFSTRTLEIIHSPHKPSERIGAGEWKEDPSTSNKVLDAILQNDTLNKLFEAYLATFFDAEKLHFLNRLRSLSQAPLAEIRIEVRDICEEFMGVRGLYNIELSMETSAATVFGVERWLRDPSPDRQPSLELAVSIAMNGVDEKHEAEQTTELMKASSVASAESVGEDEAEGAGGPGGEADLEHQTTDSSELVQRLFGAARSEVLHGLAVEHLRSFLQTPEFKEHPQGLHSLLAAQYESETTQGHKAKGPVARAPTRASAFGLLDSHEV